MESLLPFVPLALLILVAWYVARKIRARNLAAPKPAGVDLYGVGSWLALFIYASLSLAPLLTIGQTFTAFQQAEDAHPQLLQLSSWQKYRVGSWVTVIVMLAWQVIVAWGLKNRYVPASARRAKFFLLVAPAIYAASDVLLAKVLLSVDTSQEGIGALVKGYVSCLIWFWYLSASKRVKNTYYSGASSDPKIDATQPRANLDTSTKIADVAVASPAVGSNVEGRLSELHRLFELKLISVEDFDRKKHELLASL